MTSAHDAATDELRTSASAVLAAVHGYAVRALPSDVGTHPADVVMAAADVLHVWLVANGYDDPRPLAATPPDRNAPPQPQAAERPPTAEPLTAPAPRRAAMQTTPEPFDPRIPDRDRDRLRVGAEHYIDVVRGAVRRRLASGDDPNQAMLDALTLVESWLAAAGEPGFEASTVLVGRVEELLDTLATRLTPSEQLRWLRTPHGALGDRTPITAIIDHRISSVLALANDLPEPDPPHNMDAHST